MLAKNVMKLIDSSTLEEVNRATNQNVRTSERHKRSETSVNPKTCNAYRYYRGMAYK